MTEFHSLPSMLCNRPVLYSMSIIIFMFIPVFFNRGSVEPLCSAKHVVGFLEDSLFYLGEMISCFSMLNSDSK